ncbi:Lin-52-like protein, partial [Euroglyphus maynei]
SVSATPTTSIQAARPRFNLNNFILVPAGSLTNNGQMSNLIATNNTIVNKGKIMILTTTPTLPASGNATGTATGAQILTASHPGQSVQLRPSMVLATNANSTSGTAVATVATPTISTFGNTTTATSIIANIKMNPVSNQPISNQIHQIGTVPAATASVSNSLTIPATVMATNHNNSNIKQQPQAMQMLTPIVTPANLSDNNSNNNNRAHPHHQHLNFVSQNLTNRHPSPSITINQANNNRSPIKSTMNLSAGKTKNNPPQQTTNNSISTTPVILNTNNLFVTTPSIEGQQNQRTKSKPMINLNLIPSNHTFNFNQSKATTNIIGNQAMNVHCILSNENDEDAEMKSIEENQNGKRKKKNRHEKLFSDETLDRSSPELWPESVPGVVKFLANTSPYSSEDDELSNDSPQRKFDKNDSNGTRNPTLINLSAIVKNEILDDDDDYDDEEDDDDSSLQNFGDNIRYNKHNYSIGDSQSDSRKMVKSFSITAYGLETANENEDADDDSDSRATSPTESIVTNSTNNKMMNTKPNNNNKPEWQKGFDDEELSMLYGYGSLTASALLDKVKEIQNLSYQLGLEEESEVARARYLNILNEDGPNDDSLPNLTIDSEIDNIFMSTTTTTGTTTATSNPIQSIDSMVS